MHGRRTTNSAQGQGALDIALDYHARGWNPVPIPYRKKGPTEDGWQKLIITAANISKYFSNDRRMNVGVQLGPNSKGLTDIDLDCPEAITLAPIFLSPTQSIFGRAGKPLSHYLYYVADGPEINGVKHADDDKETIIELRLGNKNGYQTVFPGSTHKDTGESVAWATDGDPAPVA
jgi:hypothetical protein